MSFPCLRAPVRGRAEGVCSPPPRRPCWWRGVPPGPTTRAAPPPRGPRPPSGPGARGPGQQGAGRAVRRGRRRAPEAGGASASAAGGRGAARGGVRGGADGSASPAVSAAPPWKPLRRPRRRRHRRPPALPPFPRARRTRWPNWPPRSGDRRPAGRGAGDRAGRAGPAAGVGVGVRRRARVPADGGPTVSDAQDKELRALQAALAAEHAAVYGYGVVGGRIGEQRRTEARTAYDAHRARRDALVRDVKDVGVRRWRRRPGTRCRSRCRTRPRRCGWRRSWRCGWRASTPTWCAPAGANGAGRRRRRCVRRRCGRCAGAGERSLPGLAERSGTARAARRRRHDMTGAPAPCDIRKERLAHGIRTAAASGEGAR